MFPLDPFEMYLSSGNDTIITEQMRTLVTLIFKKVTKENHITKEKEGIRKENEVRAIFESPREQNILRRKKGTEI
jgi:hypothetical protein